MLAPGWIQIIMQPPIFAACGACLYCPADLKALGTSCRDVCPIQAMYPVQKKSRGVPDSEDATLTNATQVDRPWVVRGMPQPHYAEHRDHPADGGLQTRQQHIDGVFYHISSPVVRQAVVFAFCWCAALGYR